MRSPTVDPPAAPLPERSERRPSRGAPLPILLAAALFATLALLLAAPAPLLGQGVVITRIEPDTVRQGPSATVVLDALGLRSQGEFRDYVYGGLGLGGAVIVQPRRSSILGLRIEGNVATYGNETKTVPLSQTVGARVMVDVTTSNNILTLGLGPQLTAPSGAVRPYLGGTFGLVTFFTRTGVNGSSDNYEFASTTNLSDWNAAWTLSSGFFIPIQRGRSAWSIDVGATYHANGRMEYLRKGDIIDNNDGTITLRPVRSEADFLSFRLGVRIGG